MDDERARRLALNEAIARDVNAAVGKVASEWHTATEPVLLICECSNEACSERVRLSLDEYRAVRQNDDRFILFDGHVDERVEVRVGTAGEATVVEKIGPGRDVAEATA